MVGPLLQGRRGIDLVADVTHALPNGKDQYQDQGGYASARYQQLRLYGQFIKHTEALEN
jgi:hypothetical protein